MFKKCDEHTANTISKPFDKSCTRKLFRALALKPRAQRANLVKKVSISSTFGNFSVTKILGSRDERDFSRSI